MSLSQRKNFTKLWVMKYQNIKRRICTAVEYNTRICNCAFNILPFTFFGSNNCMDMHSVKIFSTDQYLMGGHVTTERSDVSDVVYMLLHTFNFCHGLMISSFYWIESISLGSITSCSTLYNLIFLHQWVSQYHVLRWLVLLDETGSNQLKKENFHMKH